MQIFDSASEKTTPDTLSDDGFDVDYDPKSHKNFNIKTDSDSSVSSNQTSQKVSTINLMTVKQHVRFLIWVAVIVLLILVENVSAIFL